MSFLRLLSRCIVKPIVGGILLASVVTVFAGPTQLDILGLIPGESEWLHIKKLGKEINPGEGIWLEIGGHKMPCFVKFKNKKLSVMTCFTGKKSERHSSYTESSNIEVYSILVNGFTKKFGKPDIAEKETIRTRMGVEHEQDFVSWRDGKGNRLSLFSMLGSVTAGALTLESADYLKDEEQKDAAKESKRKF